MTRSILLVVLLAACGSDTDTLDTDPGDTDPVVEGNPQVSMVTSLGEMVIEMDVENAPITANNFLGYVDSGFFDGDDGGGATLFHRVMAGFMIQGGGFTANGDGKSPGAPITLEVETGLTNDRGTIAMARTSNPDSATTQFFINHVDNDRLNTTTGRDGYAVFGKLVSGLDVLDAIASTPVDSSNPQSPRPITDVLITDCERVE
jgi:peptidyl-prolyl cis-trans isomerase A (cyclophilin A)